MSTLNGMAKLLKWALEELAQLRKDNERLRIQLATGVTKPNLPDTNIFVRYPGDTLDGHIPSAFREGCFMMSADEFIYFYLEDADTTGARRIYVNAGIGMSALIIKPLSSHSLYLELAS